MGREIELVQTASSAPAERRAAVPDIGKLRGLGYSAGVAACERGLADSIAWYSKWVEDNDASGS
jgi:nucleoside-diphosphate-sugar epimerase